MEQFSISNRYSNSLMKLGVVCRGCLQLGLDIKLADATTCTNFMSEVAGLGLESYQNGFLCHSCVRRMKKMIAFRDSVRRVNGILSNISRTKVTLQWLSQTRASLMNDTLSLSETVVVDCVPSEDDRYEDWDAVPGEALEETQAIDSDMDEQKDVMLIDEKPDVESPEYLVPSFSMELQKEDIEDDKAEPSSSNEDQVKRSFGEADNADEVILDVAARSRFSSTSSDEHPFFRDKSPEPEVEAEEQAEAVSADENVTYHCQVCDSAISNREKYKAHLSAHRKVTPFYCNLCQNYFPSSSSLEEHKVRHAMQFQCSLCDFKRREKPQVMRHYAIKHIGLTRDLRCPECREDLSERLLCLKSHPCLRKRVKCVNCDVEMDRIVMHQHEKQHRGEKMRHECEQCGKCFRHAIGVVEHKDKMHKKKKARPDENYYCVECDATYVSESSYKRHITYTSRHAREDLLKQCPECPVRMLKSALKRHILREHVRQEPFACEICPKRFFTKRGLIEHRDYRHYGVPRINEKKYTCETCGKMFSSKQFLMRHMNVHLGVKPFECKECGKRFPYDSGLYTHVLMVHRKLKRDSHGRFFKREETAQE